MKAVGYKMPGSIDRADALLDVEMPRPSAKGHDLLVQVKAVSVNPVDTKIRQGRPANDDEPMILGWDAVGEVVEVGDETSVFKPSDLGAHHVVDHSQPLAAQVETLGIGQPGYMFSTNQTDTYIAQIAELMVPQGRFDLIDDPETLDIMPFKGKSISTHWELMFTRSLFQTADMTRQHDMLNEVAGLLDAGKIRSTATETLGKINAENLKKAHKILESNTARGKLVLESF
ncbi:MAG: zinc-binding dehydrogenase [Sulfitobacter sp.]